MSKCEEDSSDFDWEEGFDPDDFDNVKFFKNSLKEYLVQHQLFDSERKIEPDELRKIFLQVLADEDPEESEDPGYYYGIFNQLADFFINNYYIDKKEIRGKDLYDLFDINQITMKFEELLGNSSYFKGLNVEEEQFDLDKRDIVGDPNPDV